MAIPTRYLLPGLAILVFFSGCKAEKPVEQKKPAPAVVVRPKRVLLSTEQRKELRFPAGLIAKVELAAGADAEPFFMTVLMHSENLKGDKGFESKKLAGFSVHANRSDDVIDTLRASLRAQGYLIFKTHKGYGQLPDVLTVIKGNNSYDLLKVQSTEGLNYHLNTKMIIAWLKEQQHLGTFVVIGAGPDWLEARFVKPPQDMLSFAKKVTDFAPDVLVNGPNTVDKLAERMKKMNGFSLMWY
ncbi:MAG TPA: DUF4253 domain-containing protein [Nitrospirota bacterium]|nr:DUF4253 domain-containing protein [Nitrospirota bacterium]